MHKQRRELIEFCGLWQKTDKNGRTFYTGKIRNMDVLVLPNGNKLEEKHPDFIIHFAKPRRRDDVGSNNENN